MMDYVFMCYFYNVVNISFCDIFWDNRDVLMGVYEVESFLQFMEIYRYVFVVDLILIYSKYYNIQLVNKVDVLFFV